MGVRVKTKYLGYGMHKSYAEYGIPLEKIKTLSRECRAGEHRNELRKAIRRVDPVLSQWLFRSIAKGESYAKMEIKMDLGEAERMPCSRSSFYARRRLTLFILDKILEEEEHGRL